MYQSISFGIVNIRTQGFAQAARLAKLAGFKALETGISTAEELGTGKVSEILDENGLFISNMGLPFRPMQLSDAEYDEAFEKLKTQVKLAEALGVTRMCTYLGSSGKIPYDENFALHVKRLKPIAEVLGGSGISLGLEFIGPKSGRSRNPYEFIYTAEGMLTLCEACGENAGLLFDAWHWFMGADNYDVFEHIGSEKKIVNVHVNDAPKNVDRETSPDNPRGLPAETGIIDIKFIMDGLRKLGYTGPVVAEPFSPVLAGIKSNYEKALLVKESMDKIFAL